MNKQSKTIFITGGHITPALALMDEIRESNPTWHMVCIGRGVALEGTHAQSVERRLVTARGATFLPLTAGRLSRSISFGALISILKIPIGYVQSLWYCVRHKPAVVVSFGGYIALPVATAAYVLRIPVITHEQTRVVGLANKMIGLVARKICVTFEDQVDLFPKGKTVVTGLPMRRELFHPPSVPPFAVDSALPILYITGGSTGAVSLNDVLFPAIGTLTAKYTVFHQTGRLSRDQAMQVRESLPDSQKSRYIVGDFFEAEEVSWILNQSALIIGRSGANTVMEAAALNKTMICIPLPWSAGGEQTANAQWLQKRGLGLVLPQKDASSEKIISVVEEKMGTITKEKPSKKSIDLPRDGARRLLVEVNAILGK